MRLKSSAIRKQLAIIQSNMKKFRIVSETSEGPNPETRYYVQKRDRFLFIPFWTAVRSYTLDPVVGKPLFFWNFNDAREYIKNYQEGKTVVVYEE